VFHWTPAEADGPGTYPVTVRVTDDGTPCARRLETITLTISTRTIRRDRRRSATATISELAAYAFTASATDSDEPAQELTFSLVGAPAGASIDGSSGAFSWTPAEPQGPGVYPFAVRVSDGTATSDAAITLTVTEAKPVPCDRRRARLRRRFPSSPAYAFTADRERRGPAGAAPDVLARRRARRALRSTASSGAFSVDSERGPGPGVYSVQRAP
jgi:hypothetical protein